MVDVVIDIQFSIKMIFLHYISVGGLMKAIGSSKNDDKNRKKRWNGRERESERVRKIEMNV